MIQPDFGIDLTEKHSNFEDAKENSFQLGDYFILVDLFLRIT